MKGSVRFGSKTIGFAAVLALASATGASASPSFQDAGEPVSGAFSEHMVVITPATMSVSVYRGETVKFVDEQSGQSFSWHFDTAMSEVDLNQVAPAGALGGQHITAYVLD